MDHEQRLRRDALKLAGDPEVLALFECLVKHIFDPALDISFMSRVCGAPRKVRDRLAARIGPLKAYVTKVRMAEAKRLVLETELPIREIGGRVAYPGKRTFHRAFTTAHGINPKRLRQQARAAAGDDTTAGGDRARTEAGERRPGRRARAARIRQRRQLGMLDPTAAAELRFELRRRHPRLDQEETATAAAPREPEPSPEDDDLMTVILTPTGDWLEELAAKCALAEILHMPVAEQRFALLRGLRLGNVTAFRELSRICRNLPPYDADAALRIARLGVELIEPHREIMGDEGDDWKARAWIDLAHVQAHAGDLGGAEKSLRFACAEVGGEDTLKPWCELELRRVEGLIRKCQRRPGEAARALDRAVELGRQLDTRALERRRTVLERLALATTQGDTGDAAALIRELLDLIEALDDDDPGRTLWYGLAFFHGAKAHAAAGNQHHARSCLQQAMDGILADPRFGADRQLDGLFTRVAHDLARLCPDDRLDNSEDLLRHAVERYRQLGMPILEAAAEAELAAVCALRGRWAEARQLATSAADFLDDLPALHREAWQAARRLRALGNGGPTPSEDQLKALLAELRHDLDLVTDEFTGPQAASAVRARKRQAEDLPATEEASA